MVNELALGKFQSSPPARGATRVAAATDDWQKVSILAPRAGGDAHKTRAVHDVLVSILAPRAGGDGMLLLVTQWFEVSILAPRAGGD